MGFKTLSPVLARVSYLLQESSFYQLKVCRGMKRKTVGSQTASKAKRQKEAIPEYCDSVPRRDENGCAIWPAAPESIESARSFLLTCASAQEKTLIVPDKDADGLDAGVIIHRTLTALGLPASCIDVHLLEKGHNVHDESEREAMSKKEPKYIIVLDQGSRPGPPMIESSSTKSLIIDHHLSDEFPENSMVVSACNYPPVATSALLAYEICKPLHPDVVSTCGFLCAMGTHGDLGNTLKWTPPFPNMTEVFKAHTKKAINNAVSLINAPRRTSRFDVITAWEALLEAKSPKDILENKRLLSARAEINVEVERQTHTPPKFTKDGKIAVFRIHSAAQVHPVIATRWAGHLSSKSLEIIMVANTGYSPGLVHFSCRIARSARSKDPPVNIISSLRAIVDSDNTGLLERMGDSFARGHKEASGGIIPAQEFEELMNLMKVGEKPDSMLGDAKAKSGKGLAVQKNNLMNYFGKS